MKEVDMKKTDIYAGLESSEKKRELDLLQLEKEANEKYLKDMKLQEQLDANEKIKKANEKAAKDKAIEERNKRLEEEKNRIKDEKEERERIKKQREKAVKNFNNLSIDEALLLLNDGGGEDIDNIFKNIVREAFDKYCNDKAIRDGMNKLPHTYDSILTDEELGMGDDMFPLIFGEMTQYEMPFLFYLLGNEGSDDPKLTGSTIADNFLIDNQAVSDIIWRRMENKESHPDNLHSYEKLLILNEVKEAFEAAKRYKDKGNDEAAAKELDKLFSKLQYKTFYAEKRNDELKVIVPAEDYTFDNFRIKDWLKAHPAKEGVEYNDDDLEYQLKFINSIAADVCAEHNVSINIYNEYEHNVPSGNDRKRYVLREIRAAYAVHANYNVSNEYDLVTYNNDMAFLADYEQGDFRRMCRENPHIKVLLDMIAAGPLVGSGMGEKQYDRYKEMMADEEIAPALSRYMRLTHSVVELVRINYKRQQYEREGWTPEKEKEFYNAYLEITRYITNDIETIKNSNLDKLNRHSKGNFAEYFKEDAVNNVQKISSIITGEMAALARGWNPSDTFLFSMVDAVYRKAYAKYKEHKNDDRIIEMSEECFGILTKLQSATSAVEKRDILDSFEAFSRKYADQKDIFEPLEQNILSYDRTKDKFEKEYRESVLKELKAGMKNKANLAQEMVKMQKIALKREETFHDEIFKEFVNSLSKDEQKELQKELYKQRLVEMSNRGDEAYKDQEEVFKRKEMGDLRFDQNIYNNVFSQIGLIRAKNDGVAAADRLFDAFDDKLSENDKKKVFEKHKEEVLDRDYYKQECFEAAEKMDGNLKDYGFKLVAAPEGGYNVEYTKPLLEIRKDVYQKLDSQVEDLEMQLTKFKLQAKKFLEEPKKH